MEHEELAKAIERGENHPISLANVLGKTTAEYINVSDNIIGKQSLDACQTLMNELLPDLEWCLNSEGKQGYLFRFLEPDSYGKAICAGLAKTPAQAWLAAIVRAVESKG